MSSGTGTIKKAMPAPAKAELARAQEHHTRDAKDYAIEFGGYLATSAERYIAAVNSLESAREGNSDQSVEDAESDAMEAVMRLKSDIYDFRKRRDRV